MITQTYQVWRCTWCGMAALQPQDFSADNWTHRCSPTEGARMEVIGFITVQLGPLPVPEAPPATHQVVASDNMEPMALGEAMDYLARELSWVAPGRPLWRAWQGVKRAVENEF